MELGGRRENDDMQFGWEEGCIIILDKTLVLPRFLFGKFDSNLFLPSCICPVIIFESEI